MPETEVALTNATIQIETGVNGPVTHRIVIDGRDVSYRVRSVEFILNGGEPADVRVTYACADLTVDGEALVSNGEQAVSDRG